MHRKYSVAVIDTAVIRHEHRKKSHQEPRDISETMPQSLKLLIETLPLIYYLQNPMAYTQTSVADVQHSNQAKARRDYKLKVKELKEARRRRRKIKTVHQTLRSQYGNTRKFH